MRIVGIVGSLRAAVEECPARAAELKDRVAGADALLLVAPEYNNSIPGVFKNAIDWMTRPASDNLRVFKGRAVGLIGASPGAFGTALSQAGSSTWATRPRCSTPRASSSTKPSAAGFESTWKALSDSSAARLEFEDPRRRSE